MRGLSMQSHAALVSILAYYGLGLPLAYFLGLRSTYEGRGLWMGQFCGAAFHCFTVMYLVYRHYDWREISRQTHERIEKDNLVMH